MTFFCILATEIVGDLCHCPYVYGYCHSFDTYRSDNKPSGSVYKTTVHRFGKLIGTTTQKHHQSRGKEAITSEFPGYYKPLSRRLYRVLEDIGASTSVRDGTIKAMTTTEILQSVYCTTDGGTVIPCYIFGSSFEGTATPGLKSDIDIVALHKNMRVVTNINEARQYPYCNLLVQDSYTPPGYAKLQPVALSVPMTRAQMPDRLPCIFYSDAEGRLINAFPRISLSGIVQHGPAATVEATESCIAHDCVDALRSCTWPDCASQWLARERRYSWPSLEQIDKCKTLGCFFVQVGHQKSDEEHLQWRLSFSLQERLLVTNFNSIQLKCYILLKMIKKERIHKTLGEKSLTSYHFKTCLLYMIENTPAEFWTEENLLVCLRVCLQQMLVWAETGVCPNYFIPEENMFDGRASGQKQIRICEILRLILSEDFKFLLSIETDMLGIRYREALDSGVIASRYGQTASVNLIKSCYGVYQNLLYLRNGLFNKCRNTISEVFAQELCKVKHILLRTNRVSEHSVTETCDALSLLLPYVDIALLSVQIVEDKHKSASNEVIFNRLASEQWHAASLEADPFSAKLKQASLMHMLGYCELSLEILLGLPERLEQQVSVCGCYGIRTLTPACFEMSLPGISEYSYEELLHRQFIPCVVYLPTERDLTPPALCYEMDRSVGSPPEDKRHWYDWAAVDGKVLFYFLLYLNHHHLGMEVNALADVLSIYRLIVQEFLLHHRDTAWNIISWISKERGGTAIAERFLLRSLNLKPTHNAAALHLQEIHSQL